MKWLGVPWNRLEQLGIAKQLRLAWKRWNFLGIAAPPAERQTVRKEVPRAWAHPSMTPSIDAEAPVPNYYTSNSIKLSTLIVGGPERPNGPLTPQSRPRGYCKLHTFTLWVGQGGARHDDDTDFFPATGQHVPSRPGME